MDQVPDDPAGHVRTQVSESAELKLFMEKLRQRLPNFTRRAALVPPEAEGSVEWLGRIGKFWWQAREHANLSREEVAERIGASVDQLIFLECGTSLPEELSPDFLCRYAAALDRPELYDEFRQRFHVV